MIYYQRGSVNDVITDEEINEAVISVLEKLPHQKVLAIPPDYTRFHSYAGKILEIAWKYLGNNLKDILPALGTHFEMTEHEIKTMFGEIPQSLFRVHKWKKDLTTLGIVPGDYVASVSEEKVNYNWPAQVNKLLTEGGHDLILSVGQVVPHEVVGMANYNKNIFVGTGGREGINKSHFLGAVFGMERIMGKTESPVRKVLNFASENFANHLPILYILTVMAKNDDNKLVMRGLYIGDDYNTFKLAADLSLLVNFQMIEEPLDKVICYLHPEEFKSTWLGNKSIYRTRMAIADEGELVVLAPGLREFGEDKEIDRLIRKYGYQTTPEILKYVDENDELKNNLSAAAHLIHGSSENRFRITYCPGRLTEAEIRKANYNYADLFQMMKKYDPSKLKGGFNIMPDGERIFYISNPALGLWSYKGNFN